jgi:hypothetical protein
LQSDFEGCPWFEVLQAEADIGMATSHRTPEAERPPYGLSAREHAFNALAAAGGQTSDAIEALRILSWADPRASGVAKDYSADYPLNPDWFGNHFEPDQQQRLTLEQLALANTQTNPNFVSLIEHDGDAVAKATALKELNARFKGNHERDLILDAQTPMPTDRSAQIERLKLRLNSDPTAWDTRQQLAVLLIRQGDNAAAAHTYLDYPPFKESNSAAGITLSNLASDAGNLFFWIGAEEQARQLYRVAISFNVGSDAEMTAAMRLHLLDRDLRGALEVAAERAERYSNSQSYYYYLSLLYLVGRSDLAWPSFKVLVGRSLGGAGPWEAALVGQRMAGMTPEKLNDWLDEPEIARAESDGVPWAAKFLLMWNSTDRTQASDTLVHHIQVLAHEPRGITEGNGRAASYPTSDGSGNRVLLVGSAFGFTRRATPKSGDPVESDLALYARALVAMQRNDFAGAVLRFDDLSARYPIERILLNGDAAYALPEFAFAAAKTEDSLKLEAYINSLPQQSDFFELDLARADFQALSHHDIDAALKDLAEATHSFRHTLGRTPSAEYQYANTVVKLYEETKDKRFREEALRWARAYEILEPWCAWAYAIEAQLSDDATERRMAAFKALYLDPLSPRLTSIPLVDLEYAKGQLAKGKPFQLPKRASPMSPPSAYLRVAPTPNSRRSTDLS